MRLMRVVAEVSSAAEPREARITPPQVREWENPAVETAIVRDLNRDLKTVAHSYHFHR